MPFKNEEAFDVLVSHQMKYIAKLRRKQFLNALKYKVAYLTTHVSFFRIFLNNSETQNITNKLTCIFMGDPKI